MVIALRYELVSLTVCQAAAQLPQAVEMGQQLMLSVQHTIYYWEGSINKFLVDDKGLLILCVFGMAHTAP